MNRLLVEIQVFNVLLGRNQKLMKNTLLKTGTESLLYNGGKFSKIVSCSYLTSRTFNNQIEHIHEGLTSKVL